jgi:hypothetical protein
LFNKKIIRIFVKINNYDSISNIGFMWNLGF